MKKIWKIGVLSGISRSNFIYRTVVHVRINHSLGSYDRTLLLIQIIGYCIKYYDMPSLVLNSTRDFPAGRGGGFDLHNLVRPVRLKHSLEHQLTVSRSNPVRFSINSKQLKQR